MFSSMASYRFDFLDHYGEEKCIENVWFISSLILRVSLNVFEYVYGSWFGRDDNG